MADWKDALSALAGLGQAGENTPTGENDKESPDEGALKSDSGRKKRVGVVYSTNPDYDYTEDLAEETPTWPKNQQKLRLSMERAGRGGKTVTIVRGFVGTAEDLQALGKLLKQKCGVGGSVSFPDGTKTDGEIIIQGDKRQQLLEILRKEGYTQAK